MLKVRPFKEEDNETIIRIWNETVLEEHIYKTFTPLTWNKHVYDHPDFNKDGLLVALLDEKVVGFVIAIIRHVDEKDSNRPGFIAGLCVEKASRRKGVGTLLLNEAETYLARKGKKDVEFSYQSTLNFPWYIPNTNGDDHPGAPGIILNSSLHMFLLNHHYNVKELADAFHLPLVAYELPDKVNEIIKANKADGYIIETYDKTKHEGLEAFYRAINAEPFERVIRENLSLPSPRPFLVIQKDNQILGWTGAMWTEESGRAHFDGITIAPAIRGLGLGKALFCTLAAYSKAHHSKFMTFFTGQKNMARYIYLSAGFKIVKSFAIMRKEY